MNSYYQVKHVQEDKDNHFYFHTTAVCLGARAQILPFRSAFPGGRSQLHVISRSGKKFRFCYVITSCAAYITATQIRVH